MDDDLFDDILVFDEVKIDDPLDRPNGYYYRPLEDKDRIEAGLFAGDFETA